MTRGTQADLGGVRVDRPLWAQTAEPSAPDRREAGPSQPNGHRRRLPKMRTYQAPDGERAGAPVRPTPGPTPVGAARPATAPPGGRPSSGRAEPAAPRPVDIDLTATRPARRPVDIDLTVPADRMGPPPASTDPWGRHGAARPGAPDPTARHAGRPPMPAPVVQTPPAPPGRAGIGLRHPRTSSSGRGVDRRFEPGPAVVERARHFRQDWIDPSLRRARRRLRAPQNSPRLTRFSVLAAVVASVLLVGCAAMFGVRSTLNDPEAFVGVTADLHRDPAVADDVSRQLANGLVANRTITADRALEAKDVIESTIVADGFSSAWRAAMRQAHLQAISNEWPVRQPLEEAVPEVAEQLREQGLTDRLSSRSVRLVPDGHVAQLASAAALLGQAFRWGSVGVLVLLVGVMARSRNRFRFAALVGVLTAALAMVALVVVAVAGESMVAAKAPEQVRSLAVGAAPGMLSSVHVTLAGLVLVAGTLGVASRLEEVRLTPRLAAHQGRRRRRSRGPRSRPVGSRSHDHQLDHRISVPRRLDERRA